MSWKGEELAQRLHCPAGSAVGKLPERQVQAYAAAATEVVVWGGGRVPSRSSVGVSVGWSGLEGSKGTAAAGRLRRRVGRGA